MASPSILLMTHNDESLIAMRLHALAFSNDIVVLDAHSTDRTAELAQAHPSVRLVQRTFDSPAAQMDFALHQIPYQNPWVLVCDASESLPPEIVHEIQQTLAAASAEVAAYRLRMRTQMGGRPIGCARGARWQVRLLRPGRVRFQQGFAHLRPVIDGHCPRLVNPFLRDEFQQGVRHWLEECNVQTSRIAMQRLATRRRGWKNAWTLQTLGDVAPLRWLGAFVVHYFFLGGMFDGRAGFQYCLLQAMREYWISLKVLEGESDFARRECNLVGRLMADDSPDASPVNLAKIDVLIPTLNEAAHIAETVANARTLGDVFVLDSQSSDGTQSLARQAGATVIEHAFIDYAQQKNWGLQNIPFTGQWIFILDADERITPQLRKEIFTKIAQRPRVNGYIVNRLPIFMGQKVQHGGLYPSWNLRLFKRGLAHYENRSVHEHVICRGPIELLHHEMLHLRRESMTRFIDKHIRYSDMESDEWNKGRQSGGAAPTAQLFSSMLRYRQMLRRYVWRHLPARPLWRFLYMFFFAFGFLDGKPGLHSAGLMACYEYMIAALYREKNAYSKRPMAAADPTAVPHPPGAR